MTENTAPRPRLRWLRRLSMLLALAVVVIAVYYAKWEYIDHRFVTITPGAVYQSAAIPADEMVDVMQEHGIRSVLDLRDVDDDLVAAEEQTVTGAGLVHVHVPMPPDPGPEDVETFLDRLHECEKPVLVHCKHGQGRSVIMCAVLRIEDEGWSPRAAFDATVRLPEGLKFLTAVWPGLRRFRADGPKGKRVLAYTPRRLRSAAAAGTVRGPAATTARDGR